MLRSGAASASGGGIVSDRAGDGTSVMLDETVEIQGMTSKPLSLLRTTLRRAGVGRTLALIRRSILEGGPLEQRRTKNGRLEMVKAAKLLPEVAPKGEPELRVHFLTGASYWYQTLFCAWSLQANSPARITPVLYDDGSLSPELVAPIIKIFPDAHIISTAQIETRLDDILPWATFPTLPQRRIEQPLIRKLIDIFAGESEWKLLLDSDMLFFVSRSGYSIG